jgi:hypothetical protein
VVNGQLRFKDESPGPDFSWADLLRKTGIPPEEAVRQQIELFNLADDPSESRNRAEEHPEIVRELSARYETTRVPRPVCSAVTRIRISRRRSSGASGPQPQCRRAKPGQFNCPRILGESTRMKNGGEMRHRAFTAR